VLDPSLKGKLDRRTDEIKEKYARPPEREGRRPPEREGRRPTNRRWRR